MGGQRIAQAKQSLILFLKSLPDNSRFNVVSFGSDFQFMFPKSVQSDDETLTDAIAQISKMDANMGGTEIAQPLSKIYDTLVESDYKPNVFVITDGQVSNTESVLSIIQNLKRDRHARVHMVGIGNGISVDMIKRGSEYGGGYHLFILSEAKMKQQIMRLLSQIVLPPLTDVQIDYDNKLIGELSSNLTSTMNRSDRLQIRMRFEVPREQIEASSITLKYTDD
jgi:uncharacterized protein YegL